MTTLKLNLYKARIKNEKKVYYITAIDEKTAFEKLRISVTHNRFEPLEVSDMKYLIKFTDELII